MACALPQAWVGLGLGVRFPVAVCALWDVYVYGAKCRGGGEMWSWDTGSIN